jgi:hypothetical protein
MLTRVALSVQPRPKNPARKYSADCVMRSCVVERAMILVLLFG